jgi:hypothetical protein
LKGFKSIYAAIPMTPVCTHVSTAIRQLDQSRSPTYRKQAVRQHCLSSWSPRCHLCPGHQCRRGRRWCAVTLISPSPTRLQLHLRWRVGNGGNLRTPRTLCSPINLTCESLMLPLPFPWPSVLKLPKSPTWRTSSEGAPCVLLKGLTMQVPSEINISISIHVISSRNICILQTMGRHDITYSEDQQMCSHWCCRRTDGHAFLARHWGRCR